jgi:hypothetical protein
LPAVKVRELRFVPLRWYVALGLFAVAVVLPLFRQLGASSWQTVFAEDGNVYAEQAIRNGAVPSLLRGYAGYAQLAPRLLSLVTPLIPLRDVALYSAVAGTTVAALAAAFAYRSARSWLTSRVLCLALAAALVVMPAMGTENTANITNVIWVLAAVVPWAILSKRDGPADVAARVVAVVLAATSTALTVVFLPLAIGWWLVRRTRDNLIVGISLIAGLAVQGIATLAATNTAIPRTASTPRQVRDEIGVHLFGYWLLGTKWIPQLWRHHWQLLVILPTVVAVAIFVALFLRAGPRARALGAVFVAYSLVTFLFVLLGRGSVAMGLREYTRFAGGDQRYSVVPLFLLTSAAAVLLDPGVDRIDRRWSQIGTAVLVAQLVLVSATSFFVTTIRSHGPDWRYTVAATAGDLCHDQPPDKLVVLHTTRIGAFNIVLPCRDVH